jgi:hypothetical protein
MSQIHYLPLTPAFFALVVGILVITLILRSVRYAYESLGVSSGAAMFLLFATLVGSIYIAVGRKWRGPWWHPYHRPVDCGHYSRPLSRQAPLSH